MEEHIVTQNVSQTQQIASKFAHRLKGGDVVLLYGNLGAGKTTFAQGLAYGLGISHRIISPTFIIMRSYGISGHNDKTFYHVDLYRLDDPAGIEGTGLLDIMGREDAISVIEWPEKMGELLPKHYWKVRLENRGEDERYITIQNI